MTVTVSKNLKLTSKRVNSPKTVKNLTSSRTIGLCCKNVILHIMPNISSSTYKQVKGLNNFKILIFKSLKFLENLKVND
jgi:hypothetical protein